MKKNKIFLTLRLWEFSDFDCEYRLLLISDLWDLQIWIPRTSKPLNINFQVNPFGGVKYSRLLLIIH